MTLVRRLPENLDLLALHAAHPERFPCLLESVAQGSKQARFDLLFVANGEYLACTAAGLESDVAAAPGNFLDALQRWFEKSRTNPQAASGDIPFVGGWVLLLGYELAREIELSVDMPPHKLGLPSALALRTPMAIVRDHRSGHIDLVVESGFEAWAETVLGDVLAATETLEPSPIRLMVSEEPAERYRSGIAKIIEYIGAGDVFQVNLSRVWRGRRDPAMSNAALYAALRRANPAPFAGILQWRDYCVASSSPERLVEVRGRRVQTRPIAGTRPRFAGDDDLARVRELIDNAKERAEHIMLIDLERNDLGRVCAPGSVVVDELMTVESYAHVHHIVSNIRGRLRDEVTPIDVIRAVFPGGTITGCPKVRCMQIIAELEGEGRGFYTGALGYLGVDGSMDLNILIRSITIAGSAIEFRAGGGIVADSTPERELEESRAKARGLLRALDPEAG